MNAHCMSTSRPACSTQQRSIKPSVPTFVHRTSSLPIRSFSAPVAKRQQRSLRLTASAVAEKQAEATSTDTQTWYALVASAESMLNDVQNEQFPEQLREKKRFYGEKNKEIDFFLVSEPAWLDTKFPKEAKQVKRPSIALVSPDKIWITFMKLRLDRVLKVELTGLSQEEVLKSLGPVPEFKPPAKWTAPYSPYAKGWWEVFQPKQ